MPKLKEKFFNKPDTLTQEKKSLGEAIKSGGMLKSARRKKGVKTDTEKEALIESMMGGGKSMISDKNTSEIFLLLLLVFLIKVFLVQYSYNTIAPKLIQNWNQDSNPSRFKQLTYLEAALFVILANNLFSAW